MRTELKLVVQIVDLGGVRPLIRTRPLHLLGGAVLCVVCWFGSLALTRIIWGYDFFEKSDPLAALTTDLVGYAIKGVMIVVMWSLVWGLSIRQYRRFVGTAAASEQLENERQLAESLRSDDK